MLRTTTLAALCAVAAVAATARAAPPPAPAAPKAIPLRAGDKVTFELTGLPDRLEGEARAVCLGTRIAAIGPVEARCERSFRFELPVAEVRMAFVFKGTGAGGRSREQRIDLPITREAKPVTFVAPSDGTLEAPAPTQLSGEAAERAARRAARPQCGECRGEGFRIESVEVTRPPLPPGGALPVRISVSSPPEPAPR